MINNLSKCFCMRFRREIAWNWSATYRLMQFHQRVGCILKPGTTDSHNRQPLHSSGCRSLRMELPAITSVLVEDQLKATVLLDSDKCKNWLTQAPCLESLPHLMTLTTKCRQAQWNVGFLEMQQGLRVSGSTYIVGIRYDFPGVLSTPESLPVVQLHPRFSTRLVHCSRSSIELFSTLHLDDLSSPVFDHLLKFVYLGKGRKEQLPDWFRNKYGYGLDKQPGTRFKELDQSHVKHEVHTKSFTVLPSHIDIFGHTNHFVYIKLIIDTISDFLCQCTSQSDLLLVPLSSMEIFYAGDCFEGDVLKVTLLECSSDKKAFLGVQISKDTNQSVIVHFQATFKGAVFSKNSTSKM